MSGTLYSSWYRWRMPCTCAGSPAFSTDSWSSCSAGLFPHTLHTLRHDSLQSRVLPDLALARGTGRPRRLSHQLFARLTGPVDPAAPFLPHAMHASPWQPPPAPRAPRVPKVVPLARKPGRITGRVTLQYHLRDLTLVLRHQRAYMPLPYRGPACDAAAGRVA